MIRASNMIRASDIHREIQLTEAYFGEGAEFTLPELLAMDLTARMKAVRSIKALRDKPVLTKAVNEGLAQLLQLKNNGGRIQNRPLKALEKVFGFSAVQKASSEALQAYNKKIGYDPIAQKMVKSESVISRTFDYNLSSPLPKPNRDNQTRVVIKDRRSERPLQILQADEFYDQTRISKHLPIARAVQQYNTSQEFNKADVEFKRDRNDAWRPMRESVELSESEAEAIDAAIDDLQKEIDHKIWYMDKKKKDMSGPYGRVYSSEYRKNMRADFATYKEQIKAWKAEIAELKKKKKGLKESSDSVDKSKKGKWSRLAESHFPMKPLKEARLDSFIIIKKKSTGDVIAKMDSDEFMKAAKAPQTQFVQDALAEYNKEHPDMEATLVIRYLKRGKWVTLGEDTDLYLEGGPGSGGQYPTQKIKMPMSPYVSVGTRKGILKNMPFDLQDVPLDRISHVAQTKFVPFKVRRLCKNADAVTKKPVCLLYVPSEDSYHVMDGHHRFLAAQKLGIDKLPAKVWSRYEEPVDTQPSPEPEAAPDASLTADIAIPEQGMEGMEGMEAAAQTSEPAIEPVVDEVADSTDSVVDNPTDEEKNKDDVIGLPEPIEKVEQPEEPIKPEQPEKPQGMPEPVHEHFQTVCEKCDSVTESCGCVNEEKAVRKTVCETCRSNSFVSPTLDAALESILRSSRKLQKLVS